MVDVLYEYRRISYLSTTWKTWNKLNLLKFEGKKLCYSNYFFINAFNKRNNMKKPEKFYSSSSPFSLDLVWVNLIQSGEMTQLSLVPVQPSQTSYLLYYF